jgi:hypothetical protein
MTHHIPQEINEVIGADSFDPELRGRLQSWREPPFTEFMRRHSTKIASNLRSAASFEDQRDRGLELFVARILSVTGCTVTYEPRPIGPDFLCEHEEGRFYCEVRRVREIVDLTRAEDRVLQAQAGQFRKLGDVIFEKFLQAEVGQINVFYIRSNRITLRKHHLEATFKSIMTQMDTHDDAFFRRHGFDGASAFAQQSAFCSAIVFDDLWPMPDDPNTTALVYTNVHALTRLTPELLRVLQDAARIPF